MLERLMTFSLRNRLIVWLLVVLILGVGAWATSTIPIDAFPDVTNIQVEVVSTAPGLSPLEIEKFVTYPIESSMRGLPGLVLMRSVTKYGISVVTLVFRDDVDVYFARQMVFERLAEVSRRVPDGVDTTIGPVATAMGEIYQYTLEGGALAGEDPVARLTRLRTLQDWVLTPLLKNVPGVTEVNSFGGYIQQFQVLADPDKLLTYDLSVEDVHQAIRNNNTNVGGNIVDSGSEEFIIRGVGLIRSEADIRNIVLKSQAGTPILVGDIGQVRTGPAVRQGASLKNGEQEAVGGIVMMLRGQNSREVVRRVAETAQQINAGRILPDGITLAPFYERSTVVERSIHTVLDALAQGAALATLVLILVLGSVRGALVVVMALPLSALLTFIVMRVTGVNANLMSLGGLAISIGMIIDATIIQVENVQRHLSETAGSEHKLSTVLKAVLEVRKPSIFGEIIIATTFIPILSLEGLEGKMFAPLALTVATALLSSLLLSIFVIPVFCALVLKPGAEKESVVMRWARRIYSPLLDWAMRRRGLVVSLAVVLLIAALALFPHLGTEFMPVMDEGAFDMDVQLLPGISLAKSLEITNL